MTILVDLSDVGIAIGEPSGAKNRIPGYVFLPNDGEPIFGKEAVAAAKLHPTRINNRFWADLNTEPCSPSHPKVRHHADLAWFYLKHLMAELGNANVTFIVPSSYDAQTLQLLAGVCQTLEIEVTGFIDRAVATCLTHIDSSSSFVHVDLQQHQTLLTFLEVENNELRKVGVEQISANGLARLQDRWLHILRQRFISSSRFDPMHSGDTEQQLFSQLNELPSVVDAKKFQFAIALDEQNLQESFSEDELSQPYEDLYAEIKGKTEGSPMVFDNAFNSVPGFKTDYNVQLAPSEAPFIGAKNILGDNPDSSSGVAYFSSGKLSNSADTDVNTAPKTGYDDTESLATHVLLNGFAYPSNHYNIELNGSGLSVSLAESDNSHIRLSNQKLELGTRGAELNLNQSTGAEGDVLRPGDLLSLEDAPEVVTAIAIGEMKK